MIVLQCSRCGHQIEISDSLRGREIRCARCGNPLALKPADESKTALGMPPLVNPPPQTEIGTNHGCHEETFLPKSVVPVPSYSMLAPAKGPDELGWLAHYRVLRLLGQGGMGMVFEAVDTHLDRSVALKVMKAEFALDAAAQERFLREARAMASVKSDYIVTVHQVGKENGFPFLAMEFLQGEPLEDWMKRHGRLEGTEIVGLGSQIARGLAAAHQRGLIHRDIKPANIFLEARNTAQAPVNSALAEPAEEESDPAAWADEPTWVKQRSQLLGSPDDFRVKILDFGLARLTRDRSRLTDPGLLMGTPGFMAPEQVEGKAVDARCDLFSLGCLLYELSTGEAPFGGAGTLAILMAVVGKPPKPVRELNPALPPALIALIEHLLAKDPKDRPATAFEVVAALDAIASSAAPARDGAVPPAVPLLRFGRWSVLGLVTLTVVLAAAALAWWRLRG